MTFLYDGVSIQNRRESNMDSLLLRERVVGKSVICIAVVCDGIGSLTDGAFASSTAVRMLNEWFSNISSLCRLGLQMRDAVLKINLHIARIAREQSIRTGTTFSALLLAEGCYYVVHTGDSRVYIWRNGNLELLTEDQSIGGCLTDCLGRSEKVNLYYNEGSFQGERFLICSDGLYKRLTQEYLQSELEQAKCKNIHKTIERLVQHAIEQGESDNISLAIVLNED